jgi:hypothetical protein
MARTRAAAKASGRGVEEMQVEARRWPRTAWKAEVEGMEEKLAAANRESNAGVMAAQAARRLAEQAGQMEREARTAVEAVARMYAMTPEVVEAKGEAVRAVGRVYEVATEVATDRKRKAEGMEEESSRKRRVVGELRQELFMHEAKEQDRRAHVEGAIRALFTPREEAFGRVTDAVSFVDEARPVGMAVQELVNTARKYELTVAVSHERGTTTGGYDGLKNVHHGLRVLFNSPNRETVVCATFTAKNLERDATDPTTQFTEASVWIDAAHEKHVLSLHNRYSLAADLYKTPMPHSRFEPCTLGKTHHLVRFVRLLAALFDPLVLREYHNVFHGPQSHFATQIMPALAALDLVAPGPLPGIKML